jgi:hypothetical protein
VARDPVGKMSALQDTEGTSEPHGVHEMDGIKFLFGLHRSILVNIILMGPGAVVVDLEMEQYFLLTVVVVLVIVGIHGKGEGVWKIPNNAIARNDTKHHRHWIFTARVREGVGSYT